MKSTMLSSRLKKNFDTNADPRCQHEPTQNYLLANLEDDRLEYKQRTSCSDDRQRLTGEYSVTEAAYSTC